MSVELPSRARVVVIGGGVIGASVAYHLTRVGWRDLVLVEQGHLSGGTTWHTSGLLGQLRATESGTRLVQYSSSLYRSLEAETGLATGYKGVRRRYGRPHPRPAHTSAPYGCYGRSLRARMRADIAEAGR